MQTRMLNRSTLVLVLISSLMLASHAKATADGPDCFQIQAAKPVNIYQSNDLQSKRLGTLAPESQRLKNLGCQGLPSFDRWSQMSAYEKEFAKQHAWCKVATDKLTGWVQSHYLAESLPAASSPTFDCAKARHQVEQVICSDPNLMAWDKQMSTVYQNALNKATALKEQNKPKLDNLKASQHGWVKGRNDCWKSQTDIKSCILTSYQQRIAYLQAMWNLLTPSKMQRFRCDDATNSQSISVSFFPTKPYASLAIDTEQARDIFIALSSTTDGKYEGEFGRSFWVVGNEALYVWDQRQPARRCSPL